MLFNLHSRLHTFLLFLFLYPFHPSFCESTISFSNQSYIFSLSENNPPKTFLGNISAQSSNSSDVTYFILSGNNGSTFFLDMNSGRFETNSSLNFELASSYILSVEARADMMSAFADIIISVVNVDDVSPSCDSLYFHIYISENTAHVPPTSLLSISCFDVDSSMLYYSIQSGNDDTRFQLANSELSLINDLNHTLTPSYSLSIRVSDNFTPSQLLTIFVQVLPSSDLPPVFTQDGMYDIHLIEDSPPSPIKQIALTTTYANSPSVIIQYSILSGDIYGQFSINSSSGLLYLNSPLDRENISFYSLSIMAFDQSVYPLMLRTALASVSITVLDINDNKPELISANLTILISRDFPNSGIVTTLLCTDADSGENGTIASYSLSSSFFRIDPLLGDVYLRNTSLPPTIPQLSFDLLVMCHDSGSPPLSRSDMLVISVRQSNLHSPNFPASSETFHVLENTYLPGRHLFEVTAYDADSDFEGEVSYKVTGGADSNNFFIAAPSIGHVHTILTRFDREVKDSYSFEVTATDRALNGFQKSSTLLVTLRVSDANDNTPVFTQHSYFTSIYDNNTVGMPLPPVSCSDLDSGTNSEIEYSLTFDPSPLLSIDSRTGAVKLSTVIRLESESTRIVTSYVICRDGGAPVRSDTASYTIQVIPVNEYPPVFQQDNYTAGIIPEDSPVGTSVIQVIASDQDTSQAGRELAYSIRTSLGSDHFAIGRTSGIITVNSRLNATQFPTYELAVMATGLVSNLSDEATVYIPIFNINEDAPVVNQVSHQNQIIPENSPPGITVASIQCLDWDDILPDKISYYIDPISLTTQEFVVTSDGVVQTGPVSTDCEAQDRYDILLICSDNESPPMTAQVSIRILISGVNEFAPRWSDSTVYFAILDESTPLYTQFLNLKPAVDDDCGSDGEIRTYQLTRDPFFDGIIFPWFNVTHDGVVYTIDYIDAGRASMIQSSVFLLSFEIEAFDNGSPSLGTRNMSNFEAVSAVRVIIMNVNDKPPKFLDSAPILISLDENQTPEVVFYSAECTDPDNLDVVSINLLNSSEPFSVSNGNISVTRGRILDYELSQQHTFYLRCSDSNFTTDIQVNILVRPLNDNPVHFQSNFYQFDLSRTATPGETIGSVVIVDADIDELALPVVMILNYTGSYNPLTVNYAGVLTLSSPVPLQLNGTYFLELSVDDGIFNDTTFVQISLVEGNLNTPEFSQSLYIIDPLFDVTPPGTSLLRLICMDSDSGTNGDVDFRITHSLPQEDFSIRSDGILRVLHPLNASLITGYNLLVSCFDSGSPVRFNTTTVSIIIIGGNVCPPVFILTETYTANIREDTPVGSMIGQVFTTDCDTNVNSGPIYSTLSHPGQFYIDSLDGKIYVKGTLDREAEDSIRLVVSALDTPFNPTHVFTIILLDVNDNSPQCSPTQYFLRLPETIRDGEFVLNLNCFDQDVGMNSELNFIPLTLPSPFSLLTDGSVYVNSSTYLNTMPDHEFRVMVVDNGTPSLSTIAVLYVSLAPANIFAPQFQGLSRHPTPISISELTPLGSLLFSFLATDNDTGIAESSVTYAIASGNLGTTFQMHPEEGRLTLNLPPDPTRIPEYTLSISASDMAALNPKTTYTTITVLINAVNRFFPTCSTPQHSLYVEEARIGPFLTLECSDADGTSVIFSIDSGDTSIFRINSTSGTLFLISPLDYETNTNHSLTVHVSDGEVNTSVSIFILVAPVNEFPPHFSSSQFSVRIAENYSVSSALIRLTASDSDRDNVTTQHGQVQYKIVAGNQDGMFTIGKSNGVVYLVQGLDFETVSFYNLTVVATDVAFSATSTLEIAILNVNDVTPYFDDMLYIFSINETDLASSAVGTVHCFDTDFSAGISQPIISFPILNTQLSINNQSGLLTLSVNASLISRSILDFVVSCWDGELFGFSRIIVSIESDKSEFTFESRIYRFSVSESLPVGNSVGKVVLTNSSTALVSFRISSVSSLFSVNSSGFIILSRSLDFESQFSHSFTVEASADSFSTISATNVIVSVSDANDNSPYFITSPISLSVEESTPEGVVLLQVTCQDSDASENGATSVMISGGNEKGFFSLTPSGTFQLNSTVDYESLPEPTIRLELTCSDRGSPPNSATTNLTYHVLPTNEHGPVFQNTPYEFSVRENTQTGASLYRVQAVDPDLGSDHNSILYEIPPGGIGSSSFLITSNGDIVLTKSLDHESISSYALVVRAVDRERRDAGVPNLGLFTDTVTIVVTVIDVNEFSPVFSSLFYLATINAGVLIDTFVFSVNCTDIDEGNSFSPLYSLSGLLSPSFYILPSGAILTNTTILYQTAPSYLLTVSCTDKGDPVLTAQSNILISVRNLDRLCPIFPQASYSIQLSESAPIGTSVILLNASVPTGASSEISYRLLTPMLPFSVNQISGEVVTAAQLDFESDRFFALLVLATDPTSNSSCNSSATVLVWLLNINDNLPIFSQPSYTASISEGFTVGRNILLLSCSDRDDEAATTAPLIRIDSGDVDSKFSIQAQHLVLTSGLDIEVRHNYTLLLTCTDTGPNTSLSTSSQVFLTLLSVNEFAPIFENETYTVSVSESSAIDTEILTLVATDRDLYGHNAISYAIISGDEKLRFLLRFNKLIVSDYLDFETSPTFLLNISASDSSDPREALVSFSSVLIQLTDENDNPPVLVPAVAFLSVEGNATVGSSLLQLSCSDADLFQNSDLLLSIDSGNSEGSFVVNSENQLLVHKPLNLSLTSLYTLIVICQENSTSPKQDSSTVVISVVNRLSRDLLFLNTPYSIVITDITPVGSIVLSVAASDPESGTSDHLQFSIFNQDQVPFVVDSNTGHVQTLESLLPYSGQIFTLQMQVTDSNMPTRRQLEPASISINRTSNLPPTFQRDNFFLNVSELAAPSTELTLLNCSDGNNDLIRYSIQSGNDNDTFSLSLQTGRLIVKRPLDFESQDSYSLVVSCMDSGSPPLSATAALHISINPENEFTPVFSAIRYGPVSINEDVLPGADILTVTAPDMDSGSDGVVTYQIIEGDTNNSFVIGSLSGRIQVLHLLDFEQKATYQLKVESRDSSILNSKSSRAIVDIELTDVNDNCPRFLGAPYFTQLPVSAATNHTVSVIVCSDADSGQLGRVSYSLGGTPQLLEYFQVDFDGVVSLSRDLPIDSSQVYLLIATCSDNAPSPCSVRTTLTVTHSEGNLSPPLFSSTLYSLTLNELFPLLTTFFIANATDTDSGTNGQISYSISTGAVTMFSINPGSGELYLLTALDFESSLSHNLTIQATDGTSLSSTRKSSTTLLTLYVTDVNDNRPFCGTHTFTAPFPDTASIGFILIKLNCSDPDPGPSGLSFAIVGGNVGNLFSISKNGVLSLASALPALVNTSDSLMIEISDSFVADAVQITTVHVLAVLIGRNDFCPQFSASTYSREVAENATVGSTLFTVFATDMDKGLQGLVSYTITGDASSLSRFTVNPSTGDIVLLAGLDRELMSSYSLSLQASDGDVSDPCVNQTIVSISVTDVNDVRPCLTNLFYSIAISERTPANSLILPVLAVDGDLGTNSAVNYALIPINSPIPFEIDPTNGSIILVADLSSYQPRTLYQYSIHAVDRGVPALSCSSHLSIYVIPYNTHPPVFQLSTHNLTLREDTAPYLPLLQLNATDRDSEYVSYSIASGNEDFLFYVDPDSGLLSLRQQLNFETSREHRLVIQAADTVQHEGTQMLATTEVLISVNNTNDNPPRFEKQFFSAVVSSSVAVGSKVLDIVCVDSDLVPYNSTLLAITRGDPNGYFRIAHNGTLYVDRILNSAGSSQVRMSVSCSDGLLTATASVTIVITARILTEPEFSQDMYFWSLPEHSKLGTSFAGVSALSSNVSVPILYSIESGNEQHKFEIDSDEGSLQVVNPLDREQTPEYLLTLSASHDGVKSLALLRVTLIDINDHRPLISLQSTLSYPYAHSLPGTVLTFIACTDSDQGSNADTRVSITAGDDDDLFSISSRGALVLDKSLTTKPVHTLTISCSDAASPPLSSTALLSIEPVLVNRFRPEFRHTEYVVDVLENITVASSIVNITAVDLDQGVFGALTYTIASGNELNLFTINPITGCVTLKSELDFESAGSHLLTVLAIDGGLDLARSSTAYVTVNVFDVNDNIPAFESVRYSVHISLNTTVGTELLRIVCTDLDSSENGDVSYSFTSSSSHFSIYNGSISLRVPLDNAIPDRISLVLQCRDKGSPPLLTTSALDVFVLKDTLAPVFSQREYNAVELSHQRVGDRIDVNISAEDRDSGNNGVVMYRFPDCDDAFPCPFDIDLTLAIVRIVEPPQEQNMFQYFIIIEATDDGTFSHTSYASLIIQRQISDTSPKFNRGIFSASVSEGAPLGSPLLSVECSNLDSNLLTYNITGGLQRGEFTVSERGVLLVSRELDYEVTSSYSLTIQCSDNGSPVRTDSAVIHISISNVNEFAPTFNQSFYNLSVSESLLFGSQVFSLLAFDRDTSPFGEISYSIVGGNLQQTFSILSTEGMVFLTGTLDYETTSSYFLTVHATDGGGLVARAYVLLEVENVNDNAPLFSQSIYTRVLSVEEPIGRNVVELRCEDRDGTAVRYGIESGNAGGYFNISAQTGLVSVARNLVGSNLVVILTVTCSDTDTHSPDRAVISFNILRDSDCPIQFSQAHYQGRVSEGAALNQSVLTLAVTGSSTDIAYALLPVSIPFIVDTSGLVTVSRQLDADTQDQYTFNAKAVPNDVPCVDPPQASVTILVQDVDEFPPVISPSVHTVVLQENSVTTSPVAQFMCADPDVSNNTVSFIDGPGFNIDPSTGQVTITATLDYELEILHTFTIRCNESGIPPKTGSATLYVMISPENEFPPHFSQPSYQLIVSEALLPGASVGRIEATDADSPFSSDGQIRYSLLHSALFSVSSGGDISVQDMLDRETVPLINFTLIASDGGNLSLTDSANVMVRLLDANDNPPQFHPLLYSLSVDSSHALTDPLANIRCTDPDEGSNAYLSLSLDQGFNLSYSLRNVTGGQGEINATLLADSPPSRGLSTLRIVCTDSGNASLSSVTQVSIFVSSDCAPPSFLSTHYTVTVPEDSNANSLLINTTASYDLMCPHQFHILSGAAQTFDIHLTLGYIYTINSLDYESVSSYNMKILVISLTASGAKSSTATVVVSVRDINDNLPILRPSRLTVTRQENTLPDQEVAVFSCSDAEAGETVRLAIESGDEQVNRFSINQQGVLRLLNPLDFETTRVYDLVISCAETLATPPRTVTAILTVLVAAVNDHDPMFLQSVYSSSLPESAAIGTTVLTLSATDGDLTTPHNKTLFALTGPNSHLFRVTSVGSLITAEFLDAEATSVGVYQFSALGYNEAAGASTATATVSISLTDVNEDPPTCGGGLINLQLQARTYSSELVGGTIACTDPDISVPTFTTSLTPDASNDNTLQLIASISGNSLTLSLTGTLAYPTHTTPNQYILSVSDGGSPNLSGDTLIYLRVIPPPGALTFSPSSSTRSVPENFPVNEVLIDVGALLSGTDKDKVSYSASSPILVTSEGVVTLATSLDFESSRQHSVQISALVQQATLATFSLFISVQDVNDNSPQFDQGNIIIRSVSESTTAPTTILTLSATDRDSGTNGQVRFSLEASSSTFGLFTVSSGGVVSLTGPLNREHTPQYSLQVRATDLGTSPRFAVAVVIISVTDVNDNSPQFQEPAISLSIPHTLEKGTVFYTIQVSDPDLNPILSFSIIGQQSARDAFEVNSNAELSLKEDLIAIPSQTFQFAVQVSDEIFSNSINVQIFVSNFKADVELTLIENSALGSVVWDATTYSSGNYTPSHTASYTLTLGNFDGKFAIGSDTGLLTTVGVIDYENEFVYTFVLQITDPSNSVNTNARLLVYLLVLDENDNDPVFNHSISPIELVEGYYIQPYELTRAVVSDGDSGVYAQLSYQLVHPETGQEATELPFYFIFDGRLFAQGEVDREAFPLLTLLVFVRDNSGEPRNATSPISITILDVNDNPPIFSNLTSPIDLISNHPVGNTFSTFSLSDPDLGSNGTVTFTMEQTSPATPSYFDSTVVSTDTGLRINLFIIESLLGLQDGVFNVELRLTASDLGSPPLSSSSDVTISVVAADIMPSFVADFYWLDVHFSTPRGSPLLTVQLERVLSTIVFSLDDVDEGDFSIDAATGTLSSKSEFQREFSNYPLKITATNKLGDKFSTTTAIVNTVQSEVITELLLNISFSNFLDRMALYEQQLHARIPNGNTLHLIEHHIQEGLVNISIYVVQGVWLDNMTSPELTRLPDEPKPFLSAETVCDLYFNPDTNPDVLACKQRVETRVQAELMFFQTVTGILVIFILLIVVLLVVILVFCLCVYIYYKRQEEKLLLDDTIFEHPYMIARPLGAYEMQQELRKLGKRGRGKPSMSEAAYDEDGRYGLGRGREYHSSDENIDETFLNQYASSESSISVYGQDYSKFEKMEAWQKYRNMGPLLRQMVERWRDGDNIILDDDESKGEMSA